MSYSGVENTVEDLEILKGATIDNIYIEPDGYGSDKITINVTFPGFVNEKRTGVFEVWQDVEGNGPGYLAFVGSGAS